MMNDSFLTLVSAAQQANWRKNNMNNERLFRFNWIVSVLILALTVASCANQVITPSPDVTIIPTSQPVSPEEESIPPTGGSQPTPEPEHAVSEGSHEQGDVLYEDDFTNPSSGWPKETYDNYYIGYHEPDYYHVQVQSPNDKTLIPVPGKPIFEDATVEIKVFTDLDNTSESGDYLYGLVLRRSGDQYYAFTISPSTKKWYVLKSSLNALEVLREGSDESIQGMSLETQDTLRVDAKGSSFFFHINDKLVDQFSDPDYTSGEVGFYVQTFDRTRIHAHFNSITIRKVQPPLMCNVTAATLYLRSGPGTEFVPVTFLTKGDRIEPLGHSIDGKWISVRVESSDQQGWVINIPEYVSCNIAVTDLPMVGP
jgi:hypothetical protein